MSYILLISYDIWFTSTQWNWILGQGVKFTSQLTASTSLACSRLISNASDCMFDLRTGMYCLLLRRRRSLRRTDWWKQGSDAEPRIWNSKLQSVLHAICKQKYQNTERRHSANSCRMCALSHSLQRRAQIWAKPLWTQETQGTEIYNPHVIVTRQNMTSLTWWCHCDVKMV